jgi:hypothetical protein
VRVSFPVPRPIVRNSGPLGIVAQAGAVKIGDQVFFKIVMARHRVPLAAFLAQPHPQPAVLREDVLDRHAECCAEFRPCEAKRLAC